MTTVIVRLDDGTEVEGNAYPARPDQCADHEDFHRVVVRLHGSYLSAGFWHSNMISEGKVLQA